MAREIGRRATKISMFQSIETPRAAAWSCRSWYRSTRYKRGTSGHDKFGRALAYVWTRSGVFVDERLVDLGDATFSDPQEAREGTSGRREVLCGEAPKSSSPGRDGAARCVAVLLDRGERTRAAHGWPEATFDRSREAAGETRCSVCVRRRRDG
jgi:hypothetical protein